MGSKPTVSVKLPRDFQAHNYPVGVERPAALAAASWSSVVGIALLLSSEPPAPLPVSGELPAVAQLTFCARPHCWRVARCLT